MQFTRMPCGRNSAARSAVKRSSAAFDGPVQVEPGGKAVSGPMDFGPCRLFNEGLGIEMIAEDEIRVTADEYWFLGRYVDEEGNVMWGTESDELNKLKRISELASEG